MDDPFDLVSASCASFTKFLSVPFERLPLPLLLSPWLFFPLLLLLRLLNPPELLLLLRLLLPPELLLLRLLLLLLLLSVTTSNFSLAITWSKNFFAVSGV